MCVTSIVICYDNVINMICEKGKLCTRNCKYLVCAIGPKSSAQGVGHICDHHPTMHWMCDKGKQLGA